MSYPTVNAAFVERLKFAIKADKRKVKEIAHKAGYSPAHISAVMHGRRSNPTIGFVEALAHTLERDLGWMLGLTNDPGQPGCKQSQM